MPRNGSDGTFVLADTIAPATLADANEMMTILNDFASETTISIAKDGQTPLTGQLKGLVSGNPAYGFSGDLNTGLGSDTADEAYLMCGGTKIAKFSAAGLNVLSGALLVAGTAAIPTGTGPLPYGGATAPAGWVLAHGGSIGDATSGATVRANNDALDLFSLIWNTSNQSGGEGQIQDSAGTNTSRGANAAADFAAHKRILIADMSDRVPRGKSGSTAYGQALGADTTSVLQANLPAVSFAHSGTTVADSGHGHGVNDAGHIHDVNTAVNGTTILSAVMEGGGGGSSNTTLNFNQGGATPLRAATGSGGISVATGVASVSVTAQGSAASGGSGTALDVKPKALTKAFIIKL
jgi:hypothetical protein